jgi:hypothetical protein
MTEFQLPQTRYAQSGDVSIAYQVLGDGPIDLILVPATSRISNSHMSCPASARSCDGSRALPAS